MKRIAVVVGVALALALGSQVGADQQGNNPTTPVAAADTGGTVTFSSTVDYVHFTNDGPSPVIIRAFVTCETIATIATTDTKARRLASGEGWGLSFSARDIGTTCTTADRGYIGFSYITTAGLTASVRWFAK